MLKSITLLLLFGGILELAHSSEEDYTWVCLNLLSGQAVSEKSTVDNILFLGGNYFKITKEGQAIKVDGLDIQAEAAFVLGGVNDPDVLHSGWGGGDGFRNFFLGDKTGQIKIAYKSGTTDVIPLIFGYSVFCNHNYRVSPEPFCSNQNYREMLDQTLFVANALDGFKNGPERYYLKIALRNEPVVSIEVQDSAQKNGSPVIRAITFSEVSNIKALDGSKFIIEKGLAISNKKQEWLKSHTILSGNPYPTECQIAIQRFQKLFYTSQEDIEEVRISEIPLSPLAKNFPGPQVRFGGSPSAVLMTNIFYENAADLLTRVDDETGMVHESYYKSKRFDGFAGWTPDWGGYYDTAYTRFRGLVNLSNMGFTPKAEKAIQFFDKWLMYWPNSYPNVQLGGKPVPGHATVIANKPHIYFDELRHHGWPTKYKTRDFGNPENDGHGILMLGRWRTWVKQGRTKEWVDQRWGAIHEAAEYVSWCLDNPELSFSEHGLLYNESEGGMQMASMYCDLPCYLGLLAYAEMADAAQRPETAQRWRKLAKRLFDAMEKYYPAEISPWGEVWDPHKTADWNYKQGVLSPLVIGMDYYGYDVAHQLPTGWLERTERSYKMQSLNNKPEHAAPAGFGYGQGYITQAALTLDRMHDAAQRIDWMAKLCFAPHLPHPYRVPEGLIVNGDGTMWRRWGDLGNLYQLNEVLYTVHLIVGIDDLDHDTLKIMPRLPFHWQTMEVKQWPVRTISMGKSEIAMLDLTLQKAEKGAFLVVISADKPIDSAKMRMGPFDPDLRYVQIKTDQQTKRVPVKTIGDSKWCWLDIEFKKTDTNFIFSAVVLTEVEQGDLQ